MLKSILNKSTAESGLVTKGGRGNTFRIRRFKNDHGFQVYSLENTVEGKIIFIPRFLFGRFRACVRSILKNELNQNQVKPFELATTFLNKEYFYFKSSNSDIGNLIIQDIEEREGSSGYITVSRRSVAALDSLLYDNNLQHPNDVLEEIISYHKLFQFSFVKGSKSITSGLAIRKDVLHTIKRFTPDLAQKLNLDSNAFDKTKIKADANTSLVEKKAKSKERNVYTPKLGERFNAKDIKVDYEDIFGDRKIPFTDTAELGESQQKKKSKVSDIMSQFSIPLLASEVKAFKSGKLYFELSTEEASRFRDAFIKDRSSDYYLGFEICDALFSVGKSIKTFQFPLYYTKVRIRESGRGVHLDFAQDGLFFLNHLALTHLVEKFSETVAGIDQVDKFFKTLLAQDVSVDRLNDRICLSRYLPIKEAIFDRTREILLGYQDESGKGGILGDLKLKGIECDLDGVYLYRAPKLQNPLDQALDLDLDQINTIAHDSTKRFYQSLLGKFLTPEQQSDTTANGEFASVTWMPGALPLSTRNLINNLNDHELVLLEGPPGTGKTYTIMNLLIHCIANKQRILIVSDQQGAIEALVEKLQAYLVGNDRGTSAERKWKDLLFSAIKVIDDVETGQQTLSGLLANLVKRLNVQELSPGLGGNSESHERDIIAVGDKIERLKRRISQTMLGHMGAKVPFDHRIPKKGERSIDHDSLIEFLSLLQGDCADSRELVHVFIQSRFTLKKYGMEDCYNFFKIPEKDFDSEINTLKEDEQVLNTILQKKPRTFHELDEITSNYPKNEIIRHLEAELRDYLSPDIMGVFRFIRRIISRFSPPLNHSVQILHSNVRSQIKLLQVSSSWSPKVLALLRDVHESIRVGGEPHVILGIYHNLYGKTDSDNRRNHGDPVNASIQADLEQIDDLFIQQDRIVRERLVDCLCDIVRNAVGSKHSSGTNNITSIMSLVDSLKQFNSLNEGGGVLEELKQKLFDTFPIWVVRKQTVPFLLPCTEKSFDLVVVDEATQCRVDDAMSLMFRAKRILVVGDDKQTVLQKNSVIDDYLFKDHELDEHLRSTQARGFKGGGSHIFALVKAIKQASVMLDEHYRCPADIIQYSNKYVYENGLNIMQWSLPEHPAAVVVDYSEEQQTTSKKATSGKFKGIETEMIDRFMDYITKTIKSLEKSLGKRIDVETDVALCYFLLKNEPYVKHIKQKYLQALDRGEDILDGAGAALQGKERDYIFYLWDVTRYNMSAFKQGDDADKRKGELNVLMSRPKKMAFHFLHRNFEQLDHSRTNITNYLWNTKVSQDKKNKRKKIVHDTLHDSQLGALLEFTIKKSGNRGIKGVQQRVEEKLVDFRDNIEVGDEGRVVDLVAFPRDYSQAVLGIVDLTGFGNDKNTGQIVMDYYFQLKRVSPSIEPVFVFPHELLNENGQTFSVLVQKLEKMLMAIPNHNRD